MSLRLSMPNDDDALAAEYVLVLLPPRRQVELARRIETDADFSARVSFWQSHFAALDAEIAEVNPPAATLPAIERRLFGSTRRASFWDNLAIWRGLAGLGLASALVAIGVNIAPLFMAPQLAGQMVATLEQAGSPIRFMALYDGASGMVRLTSMSGDAVPDRDYELWAIQGENAPVSMGVVPMGRPIEMAVPQMSGRFGDGTVLAITLEPKGGSPSGAPTGPIVASGTPIAI